MSHISVSKSLLRTWSKDTGTKKKNRAPARVMAGRKNITVMQEEANATLNLNEYAPPSRKWSVPRSYLNDSTKQIIIDTDYHDLRIDVDMDQWLAYVAGGYVGISCHGDRIHLGSPGFALSLPFVDAMEQLQKEHPCEVIPLQCGVGRLHEYGSRSIGDYTDAARALAHYCEAHCIPTAHNVDALIDRIEQTYGLLNDLNSPYHATIEWSSVEDLVLDGKLFSVAIPYSTGHHVCYRKYGVTLGNYRGVLTPCDTWSQENITLKDLGPVGQIVTEAVEAYYGGGYRIVCDSDTRVTHHLDGWRAEGDDTLYTSEEGLIAVLRAKYLLQCHCYRMSSSEIATIPALDLDPRLSQRWHGITFNYTTDIPGMSGFGVYGHHYGGTYLRDTGDPDVHFLFFNEEVAASQRLVPLAAYTYQISEEEVCTSVYHASLTARSVAGNLRIPSAANPA